MDALTTMSTNGTFRLKSRELVEQSGKTLYRISEDGGASYASIHRWANDPKDIGRVDLNLLYDFLRGLGYSHAEVLGLQLGDIFELSPEAAE